VGDIGGISTKISTVAAGQYGHITRAQLLEIGLGTRGISNRIESGKLVVVHAGVYAVGYPRPEAVARAAAAVLACGPGAALSHSSAAVLWGILSRWPQRPEVTLPGDRRRPGIKTHRSSTLTGRDIRRRQGIRVTSPARTVLEIAPRLTDPKLARALNDGRLHANLRPAHLEELLERLPHHRGTARLRALTRTPQAPTRSAFEDAFLKLCNSFNLPTPRVNTRVAGYLVDALFPDERLIVELDGYEFHQDRTSFKNDRERDAATLATGHATVRITWERLQDEPDREATRLHQILRARRAHSAEAA